MAVRAAINEAGYLIDERPADVPTALQPAREIAEAWAFSERLAWIEYCECEACLATGTGSVGSRPALPRRPGGGRAFLVVVRTLSAVLPWPACSGDRR